jgi:hypothetical protein
VLAGTQAYPRRADGMSLGQKGRLRMYASITRLELKDEDSIGAAVDALDGLLADARGVAGFRDC